MNTPGSYECSPDKGAPVHFNRCVPDVVKEFRRVPVTCCAIEPVVDLTRNSSLVSVAQAGSQFNQCVQHCLQVEVERLITLRTSAVAVCC